VGFGLPQLNEATRQSAWDQRARVRGLIDGVLVSWQAELARRWIVAVRSPNGSSGTAGLWYYRDGRDSVAWTGDTIGRGCTEDTMVAIISVGAVRMLALWPRGGPTIRLAVGSR